MFSFTAFYCKNNQNSLAQILKVHINNTTNYNGNINGIYLFGKKVFQNIYGF